MKKSVLRKLLACGLGVLMVSAMSLSASAVSISDYKDVTGHWAYSSLERAVKDGVLNGSDSQLTPDRHVTGAEMAVMLVRAKNLQFYTNGYIGADEDAWYYRYAAIAAEAGFLPADGSIGMNQYVTRQQVFKAFVDAYGFDTEDINASEYLSKFHDTVAMDAPYGKAAAVLLKMGVITGDEWGQLRPFGNITRAEFVKILYLLEDLQGGSKPAEENGTDAAEADGTDSADGEGTDGTPADNTGTTGQDGTLWDGSRVKYALQNAVIKINIHEMKEGSAIDADVTIENVDTPITCFAEWFYDNAVADGYTSSDKLISNGTTSTFHRKLVYSRDMTLTHSVGFELSVTDPATGVTYHLYAQAPVTVINYPASHYATSTGATTVSYGVSCVYNGNYTTSYNIDYSKETKTQFVNGNGYGSKTNYLLWANLHTQKVNVFTGGKGNWTLVKTFRIGSGARGTSTPTGVTYITRKEASGWTTSTYTVKPVMRFYPGTGYAFHSVLFYPNSTKIRDGRVGMPVSHGCLRMQPADIQWLYDNVPVNTTVVIY